MISKNRIIKYLLFILLLVATDRIAGALISNLAKKQIRDNRVGLLIENKIPAQIYILGSSRALNNYSPAILSGITAKTCYNLGVSGSNILFHETLLDLIIQSSQKPEIIIYNIDDYGTLFYIDNIIYRKDVLYPYVDNDYVNRQVSLQVKRNVTATRLCDTYRQNINFINSLKYLVYGREEADYKTTNIDSLGANLLEQRPGDKVPVFGNHKIALPTHTPDIIHLAAFKRIQEKCKKNNIKLVLVLPPLYTIPSAYFRQQVKKQGLPGIYWIDFTHKMQDAKYFYNTDHMNKEGATIFTEKIAIEINKIIG